MSERAITLDRFLLQMAGEPGTGKSSLARAIGQATNAVVIDKDVIKSAALNAGAEESLAAPLAYEVFFELASSLLRMGHSVILDSPTFWPNITTRGQRIATGAEAKYFIIECTCSDRSEQARRLQQRSQMRSQMASLQELEAELLRRGVAPLALPRLMVDSIQPLSLCVQQSLRYLQECS